jgi:hypothetical protein
VGVSRTGTPSTLTCLAARSTVKESVTTTDTYSHVMPALGRDAAERMGNALWD